MGCCCCCCRDDCSTPYTSVYDLTVLDMDGRPVSLNQYKGKVLIIVNVASKCGLTDNHYRQLTELYARYQSKGFEVLGFPCNQFMRQEPGSCPMIKGFLEEKGVPFPVFDKVDINGRTAHPLFKFLRSHSRLNSSRIGWNFGKFLVSRDGHIYNYYGPRTDPMEIVPDIEKLL